MGQVLHALLTRPPLSHLLNQSEEINRRASLDLHVLSTPPAFILSQDQTLIKNVVFEFEEARRLRQALDACIHKAVLSRIDWANALQRGSLSAELALRTNSLIKVDRIRMSN